MPTAKIRVHEDSYDEAQTPRALLTSAVWSFRPRCADCSVAVWSEGALISYCR
jgi:hypothetical protein